VKHRTKWVVQASTATHTWLNQVHYDNRIRGFG